MDEIMESNASPQLTACSEETVSEHRFPTVLPQAGCPPWSWSLPPLLIRLIQAPSFNYRASAGNSRSVFSLVTTLESSTSLLGPAEDQSQCHGYCLSEGKQLSSLTNLLFIPFLCVLPSSGINSSFWRLPAQSYLLCLPLSSTTSN